MTVKIDHYTDRNWHKLGDKPKRTLRKCADCPAEFYPRGPTKRCQPCQGDHLVRTAALRSKTRRKKLKGKPNGQAQADTQEMPRLSGTDHGR